MNVFLPAILIVVFFGIWQILRALGTVLQDLTWIKEQMEDIQNRLKKEQK
jgi:hypothetical protein